MIIRSVTGQLSFYRSKKSSWRKQLNRMDSGNSWPAAGYAGGQQDTTIMNRIMLRFRPIAPKPVTSGSSPGSTPEGNKMELVSKRRVKRKYVRVQKYNKFKSNKEDEVKKDGSLQIGDEGSVSTLQLMPESSSGFKNSLDNSGSRPFWMNFQKSENFDILAVGSVDKLDRKVEMHKKRVVESWLMVDRMTNTLVDGEALGSTDSEKIKNLEADTCPGLISDGLHRVQWVNLAYRRMVDPLSGTAPSEMVTWLAVKEKIELPPSPAFACTVRIVYTKYSQTMPCDVWKMEFGGFAWRLDAKAALRLGR